jgi:hypothetical protein
MWQERQPSRRHDRVTHVDAGAGIRLRLPAQGTAWCGRTMRVACATAGSESASASSQIGSDGGYLGYLVDSIIT